MNKKIASEFAVGIILLLTFVFGGIFWLNGVKEIAALNMKNQQVVQPMKKNNDVPNRTVKNSEPTVNDGNSCKPHYYEGKARVSAWLISEGDDGIIIAIKKDEISKLPIADSQTANNKGDFTVKLIDSTDEIVTKIKESSPQKPATITIQGYAEICQQPPLVSIKPATDAFKKRS